MDPSSAFGMVVLRTYTILPHLCNMCVKYHGSGSRCCWDGCGEEGTEPIWGHVEAQHLRGFTQMDEDAAESAVEEETRVPQQSPDASETVDLSHKSPSAETRHMVHSISRPTEGEDQNLRPALTTSMPNP